MKNWLSMLQGVSVVVFAVTSMLSVGLGHTVRELMEPLRHAHGVIRALTANFVLVPILALGVVSVLPLDQPESMGLVLISTAAGAPFLIKLTEHAEHDVGMSATLLVLLLPATVLYMPLAVPFLVPYAMVDAWAIAMPLLLTMLLPLGVGLFAKEWFPVWAEFLGPFMSKVSSIALVVLVTATLLANFRDIVALIGTGDIFGAILVIAGAFLIGYALGGHDPEARGVLGLATGQRNIAAATVVAAQGYHSPGILVMVVSSSLVALALLFPTAWVLRHRLARHTAAESENNPRNEG